MASLIKAIDSNRPGRDERRERPAGRRRVPVWRWAILLIAGVYFLLPLWAALRFAGWRAFGTVFVQPGFWPAIWLSARLAVMTTLITLALMVPTVVYVHLRLPGVRRLLEGITITPIVIPPVVLAVGVLQVSPSALKASPLLLGLVYVILAMPFAYRAIDAGLRALDLKTLTEAAGSLGAGWATTLWRVILPNLRTALLSSTVLIVALVLGEFTIASLDLFVTFPVWIVQFDQLNANMSVAASIFALVITWLLLMVIVTIGSRQSRRTGGTAVTLFTVARTETKGN
jgi:putative spermidine/putrescine transport system permease protein